MRYTIVLFCWLFLAVNLHAQTTGTTAYQANFWDKDVTLPPGSYRAAKPLALGGDFTVRAQPRTLLDAVAFLTTGGRQHYHLEGTLLRRCRFTTKMNAGGHFIDSVLEDCDFFKDDNWYMFWWSTHWRYDNCIFTKRVVRGDLYPLDYSVHASRCTVYGAKLPGVGFKENNAWMGGEDMVFEKCRFVDCDVPQSFLACTRDCVFEGCRFEPKTQLKWSKETVPLKVHAYYASGGTEPPSFINGPLSVEFEKAPMNVEAGSTIPHTQSGGRITLTKDRLSEQFTMLGTVSKKASEIVEVAATTPAPTATPVVTGAAATGAAGPSAPVANEIGSVEEILRALPANVEIMARGLPNPAGVEVANAFLVKTFAGRPVALRLLLAGTQATTDDGYAYQASAKPQGVLYHGATIPADVTALFRAVNVAPLAKLAVNSELPVRGVVRRAEFVGRGTTLGFNLGVGEARVADALSLRAVAAAPAVAGEVQVVGDWTALVRDDGNHSPQSFSADHACTANGNRFGTWELRGNQFIIHFDDNTHADTYDLPVRDGVLYGKSSQGWRLSLTRQGTPTPPAVLAQVVGSWKWYNRASPDDRPVFGFNTDGTFTKNGTPRGHWKALGLNLVMEWDKNSNDIFELPPAADGTLKGTNVSHADLTLTRTDAATPTGSPKDTYFGHKLPR